MLLEFIAHATFLLRTEIDIVIDPYATGIFNGRFMYPAHGLRGDLVLCTHDHLDHGSTETVGGKFDVFRGGYWRRGSVTVESVRVAHDNFGGRLRGGFVEMMLISCEGLRILHCGDIGENLKENDERFEHLREPDVMIVPIGGFYTLEPDGVLRFIRLVNPKVALLCHYLTPMTTLKLRDKADFIRLIPEDYSIVHLNRSIFDVRKFIESYKSQKVMLFMKDKFGNG